MFRLEQALDVHSSDIKDIILRPGLRATIKVLYNEDLYTLSPCRGYINCMAITPSSELYAGCQDGTIVFYSSYDAEPVYLAGHTSNVCALDYHSQLLSGSWDHDLKEWNAGVAVFSFTHPASVWACRYVSDACFVSACADAKIRIFHSKVLKVEVQHHLHCVRSLWIYNDIYSVSNEGSFIHNGVDGRLIRYTNYDLLLYFVYVDENFVILSGDKGTIVVNGTVHNFPVSTIWKAVVYDGKIHAAGSDGKIYILSKGEDGKSMHRGAEAASDVQNDDEKAKEENSKCTQGEVHDQREDEDIQKEIQNQKKKVVNGKVYTLVDNEWVLLGEVVKKFDHTFNVDVEGKTLQISFNEEENVFEVADRFLKQHKLNEQYKDDVVEFINKNFRKTRPYHVYENINYDGVEKTLQKYQSNAILENLKNPLPSNSEEVEKNIKELMKIQERFVLLDCYRYFVTKGFEFNFAFLTRFKPRDRKEALVFIKLVTNLYSKQPFNLECLREQINNIKDKRLVSDDVNDKYEKNRELSRK